jgi:hypothetical protein
MVSQGHHQFISAQLFVHITLLCKVIYQDKIHLDQQLVTIDINSYNVFVTTQLFSHSVAWYRNPVMCVELLSYISDPPYLLIYDLTSLFLCPLVLTCQCDHMHCIDLISNQARFQLTKLTSGIQFDCMLRNRAPLTETVEQWHPVWHSHKLTEDTMKLPVMSTFGAQDFSSPLTTFPPTVSPTSCCLDLLSPFPHGTLHKATQTAACLGCLVRMCSFPFLLLPGVLDLQCFNLWAICTLFHMTTLHKQPWHAALVASALGGGAHGFSSHLVVLVNYLLHFRKACLASFVSAIGFSVSF